MAADQSDPTVLLGAPSAFAPGQGIEDLSPLEQDLLDEYERLADNMKKLAQLLDNMAGAPTSEILDGLRQLERKTSLVFTALKASVYSMVLEQQEVYAEEQDGRD